MMNDANHYATPPTVSLRSVDCVMIAWSNTVGLAACDGRMDGQKCYSNIALCICDSRQKPISTEDPVRVVKAVHEGRRQSWWKDLWTRSWADAQRDGRPAEYRWRPLLNTAKFGWRPLVTALIGCGVCEPSNYTGFYIKCNLLRNKEK